MPFCTGSPLYFCEFLLIYNIAQYNIAQYFLWQMKPFPLGCSQLPSGLSWQNLLLRPSGPRSPGLILTESLSAPRWSEIPGAYFDRISCCAPLVRDPRGLLRQNPFLRPAGPRSPGLILTKSLSKPRYPGIDGAYYGKIPFCAPLVRDPRGLSWQNLLLRPAGPISPGPILTKSLSAPRCPSIDEAYYGKILIYAPISRYRRGLLRQNPYLCPDVQRWRV